LALVSFQKMLDEAEALAQVAVRRRLLPHTPKPAAVLI